jgi:hypothetical protein
VLAMAALDMVTASAIWWNGWLALGHPNWAKIDVSEKLVQLKLRRDNPSNLWAA